MKIFNRAIHQQIIHGHVIPCGAFYGKVHLKYEKRTPLEKRIVRDKNGNIIFTKDGLPKTRIRWRIEQCADTVYYSVETLHKMDGNFIAYIAYENNGEKLHWCKRALGECVATRELNNFITKKVNEYLTANHTTWKALVIHTPHVADLRDCNLPKRKEAQKQYIYRGIPMRNPDDTDVKPRMPIVKTNMDKLHPIDERPVIKVETRSYDDSKVVHPTNSGYIRNEDGTVTTRNGDNVKTALPYEYTAKPNKVVENKNRKPARVGYHYAG